MVDKKSRWVSLALSILYGGLAGSVLEHVIDGGADIWERGVAVAGVVAVPGSLLVIVKMWEN